MPDSSQSNPNKQALRILGLWLWMAVILFGMGFKFHNWIHESQEFQVASTHVSIAWQHVPPVIYRMLKESLENVLKSIQIVLQTVKSLVMSPIGTWIWTIMVVLVCVHAIVRLYQRRRRAVSSTNQYHCQRQRGDDVMEILRTTRERASTFDFFGTHASSSRERSESIGDYSAAGGAGGGGSFRRERVGSMDLFYSQRGSGEHMDAIPSSKQNAANNADDNQHQHPIHDSSKSTPKRKNQSSKRKIKRKASFASTPSHGDMPHDPFFAQQAFREGGGGDGENPDDDEAYLFDEFGLVTLSYEMVYYGPTHTGLLYETWTPPTSWNEVSRRIIPQDIMLKLRRSLVLDMNQGTVTVKEPESRSGRWDFSLPALDFSIHVEPPVEGAVMSLYVKGTPKHEWLEHTFQSAQTAAQFQLDLLAYQVLGKTLTNMFQALSLVHLGSQAYEGPEFVLHYNVAEGTEAEVAERRTALTGVAWDDAMRALSSIPTIRIALERLWLHHHRPNDDFNQTKKSAAKVTSQEDSLSSEDGLLTEEYSGKRLLLGPVDFFRLFVPALPDTALPQSESNRARMEQLLSWRKRAARAAVLIRTYTMSHRVVNVGWHLPHPVENLQSRTLRRRLAFDDNEDNNRRDVNARDEVYEASVSRDVLCHVRPFDYLTGTKVANPRSHGLVLSPYQAYALIGVQVFRKPQIFHPSFPLNASQDPVEALPSLQHLIANNSDLDFFITSYHREDTVSILCYVRSLAKGIDPHFDNVVTRFTDGDKETRDRKVHMMMQMGQSQTLSFLGMLLVRFLSFLFSLTKKGRESPLSLQARRDRIPFPAIRVASYGQTYHFGGSLQKNTNLPTNYVGMNMAFNPQGMPNFISRVLFTSLNDQMSERVLDFTLVLEGEHEDELPERALCTTRLIRVDTAAVARVPTAHDVHPVISTGLQGDCRPSLQDENFQMWSQRVATEVVTAFRTRLNQKWTNRPTCADSELVAAQVLNEPSPMRPDLQSPRSEEPIDIAIGEFKHLLKGVEVPVRTETLETLPSPFTAKRFANGWPQKMVLVPVVDTLTRQDMKRFLVSSSFDVKVASIRMVQTAAWRGQTFPIDIRRCRIELQSGQFFHQGHDRLGNAVCYFSTMCRGPWRRNPDATILAALHRFDNMMTKICAENPVAQCTFVVLMGLFKRPKNAKEILDEESLEGGNDDDEGGGTGEESQIESAETSAGETASNNSSRHILSNPRIDSGEIWQLHSTHEIVEDLISLIMLHYPERIARILLAKGKGPKTLYKTKLAASRAMKRVILPDGRGRVNFLLNPTRLRTFIDDDELSEVAGGSASFPSRFFDAS